jgi:ATP synthase protein I
MHQADWPSRRRVTTQLSLFLAAQLLFWLVTPYKPFFAGLFLGGLVSLYNHLYLLRKVRNLDAHADSGASKRRGSGLVNRLFMVAIPLLFAAKYPASIDFRAVLIGLPLAMILTVVAEFRDLRKQTESQRKG